MRITDAFIDQFAGIPLGVFDLFRQSFVRIDPHANGNDYKIRNNRPYISAEKFGGDQPLLHELGHFAVAADDRLHLDNYGYKFPYESKTRWHDLECELKVLAVELNLLRWYGLTPDATPGTEAQTWNYLAGWTNYQRAHHLTDLEMQQVTQHRYTEWSAMYTAEFFFREWKRKNTLLKTRIRKFGTLEPHVSNQNQPQQ